MALSKRVVTLLIISGLIVLLVVKIIQRKNSAINTDNMSSSDNTAISPLPVAPSPPVVPEPTQKARWIRIQRAVGSDYVNISGLIAWDENNNRIRAVSAEVVPNYSPLYPASNLLDDDRTTFVHTTNTSNAYCEIDLGSEYNISKVTIWNRPVVQDRMIGTKLILFSANRIGMTIHPINRSMDEYNIKVFKGGSLDI